MIREIAMRLFDIISGILVWAMAGLILLTLLYLGYTMSDIGKSAYALNSNNTETIYSCKYNSDIAEEALTSLFYSSKKGVVDGGLRESTVDCLRYVGSDITILGTYNYATGLARIVTADRQKLYLVVEDSTCSYVFEAPDTYESFMQNRRNS